MLELKRLLLARGRRRKRRPLLTQSGPGRSKRVVDGDEIPFEIVKERVMVKGRDPDGTEVRSVVPMSGRREGGTPTTKRRSEVAGGVDRYSSTGSSPTLCQSPCPIIVELEGATKCGEADKGGFERVGSGPELSLSLLGRAPSLFRRRGRRPGCFDLRPGGIDLSSASMVRAQALPVGMLGANELVEETLQRRPGDGALRGEAKKECGVLDAEGLAATLLSTGERSYLGRGILTRPASTTPGKRRRRNWKRKRRRGRAGRGGRRCGGGDADIEGRGRRSKVPTNLPQRAWQGNAR